MYTDIRAIDTYIGIQDIGLDQMKFGEILTTNLFAFLKMKILQTSVGTGQVDFRPLREHAPKVRCPVCNKKISYDPLAICFSVLDIT